MTIKSPVVVASCISFAPTKCILRFVGSVGGRWRPALRFAPRLSAKGGQFDARVVVASCISLAPGQGRELSHSAAPPLPMSAIRTHWEPEVFSATYTPPPKMITVPFAPTGRETLRGFFDKQTPPSTQDGGEFFVNARAAIGLRNTILRKIISPRRSGRICGRSRRRRRCGRSARRGRAEPARSR